MPVPWAQIIRFMPSILDVSRELLKRTRRLPAGDGTPGTDVVPAGAAALEARVVALEENERRQAELVNSMADQLAQLTGAVTTLHGQVRLLIVGQVVTAVLAIAAVVVALR
jgi:uncharacterized coiled-coil protein SlyX